MSRKSIVIALFAGAATLLSVGAANAGGVSIHLNLPLPPLPQLVLPAPPVFVSAPVPVYAPAPVYQQEPVYVPAERIVYRRAPVYAQPVYGAPVYGRPVPVVYPRYYGGWQHGHDRRDDRPGRPWR